MLAEPGSLDFGLLVRGGLSGIFPSQALGSLFELSYPLAQSLTYLRQFPHPEDEHEDNQDNEEFWYTQTRHEFHRHFKERESPNYRALPCELLG